MCAYSVGESCLTLFDPIGYSPPGSSVHGIFQARILLAISSSRDLPNPGMEPVSPVVVGRLFITKTPAKSIRDI